MGSPMNWHAKSVSMKTERVDEYVSRHVHRTVRDVAFVA
jgi:hypothetical protein